MSGRYQFGTGRRQPRSRRQTGQSSRRVLLALVGWIVWSTLSGSVWAQTGTVPPPPPGMSYSTRLDRTAIWVGDQFHYTITVVYSPNYEFVLENLGRETINMEPFQVVEVSQEAATLQDGNQRLLLDLTLASFSTGQTTEQIPQITLFYFRKDQQNTSAPEAAAESMTVPGPVIGVRTTLTPGIDDIRDAVTVTSWAQSRWWLPGVGMVALLLLIAGGGWEAAVLVKKRRGRKGPDPRKAMEAVRGRWASAVPSDFGEPQRVMEFFNQSYRDVKEYVGYFLDVPTLGLTAEELQSEMQRLGANPDFSQKVTGILSMLETVRYSANGLALTPDSARSTAQEVREIFAWSSRR